MKKIFAIIVLVVLSTVCVYAEDTVEQTKTEQVLESMSVKTQEAAAKTADSVKSGSKKAGNYIKEKSY